MKNKQARALDAVKEIRKMFKASGITENELQNSGEEIRLEIMKRYSSYSVQKTPSTTLLSSRGKER